MQRIAGIIGNDLLELLYPTRCLGCEQRGTWFCTVCTQVATLRRELDHCLICNRRVKTNGQLCRADRTKTGLTGLQSFGDYHAAPLRQAIGWVKYQGIWAGIPELAAVASTRLNPVLTQQWTAVIPIPLSPKRFRERGFNQAELIAQRLCTNTSPRLELTRRRDTKHQTQLNRAERLANVADAFQWTGEPLTGRVLLVDDVVTTGATLGAAARTLRAAGAKEVWAVTLAYDLLVR